jgi:phenylacetate-CoA ligase
MVPGKRLYDRLPVWAQSVAVNATSARGFRQKYGPAFHATLARLEANERKSRDQLLTEQARAVREMLAYARRHVPYYRRLDAPPDDIAAWPILEKRMVAAWPLDFLSDEFDPDDLMTLRTSGTTGTPLSVRFTREYHQMEMAFRWRHKAWGGVPFPSRSAYLSGHPVVPPGQKRPPFWRWDRVEQRLLCSSYHLSPQNLPAYVGALAAFAPAFVHGYPSSVDLVARQVLAGNGPRPEPRAVFTASETLLDFQRTTIESAFGVKVFNWYGNTEMTCNVIGCAAGGLHVRPDYGFLELLADGTMVCTGLNNRAMPLIRYRVGDVAVPRDAGATCACGCAFPLVERIEGRVEDYVRTPDGRRVGRLDHLFKDVSHVREAQLVQHRPDELVVRIVTTTGFGPRDEETIRAEARQRLGTSVGIRFEFPSEIARTGNGKFRFVVSEMREQAGERCVRVNGAR